MRPMLEVLANKNLPFKVARYVRSVASKAGNAFTKAMEGQRALPYKVAEHDPQSGNYNVLASFNTREAAENHPTGTHIIQTQQWWGPGTKQTTTPGNRWLEGLLQDLSCRRGQAHGAHHRARWVRPCAHATLDGEWIVTSGPAVGDGRSILAL